MAHVLGTAAPPPDGTARRVLAAIRLADEPPTVADLCSALGLHRNTVRQHLTALLELDLVSQGRRHTGGKGRPQEVYRATAQGRRAGQRNYALLAAVLIERVAAGGGDPARVAREAGRSWGAALAGAGSVGDGQVRDILEFLDEAGFEPLLHSADSADSADGPWEVALRNCPFRELADTHAGLVCGLHEGLLDGLVGNAADPHQSAARVELEPFVTPTTCLVRVSPGPEAPAGRGHAHP